MSDLDELRDMIGDEGVMDELREQTERASRVAHELHRVQAERDRLRRELEAAVPVKALVERNARLEAERDRLREALTEISNLDPREFNSAQAWAEVQQDIATDALNQEQRDG